MVLDGDAESMLCACEVAEWQSARRKSFEILAGVDLKAELSAELSQSCIKPWHIHMLKHMQVPNTSSHVFLTLKTRTLAPLPVLVTLAQ